MAHMAGASSEFELMISWRLCATREPQTGDKVVVWWNVHIAPVYLLTPRNKPNFQYGKAVIQTIPL